MTIIKTIHYMVIIVLATIIDNLKEFTMEITKE